MNKRVKCDWLNCAHGMKLAGYEGECECHVGDSTDEHCKGFIAQEEWEKQRKLDNQEEV